MGFDWSDASGVLKKVEEEIGELKAAIRDQQGVEDELGDVLFTIVNLSRRLGVDPDRSLSAANRKFKNRFERIVFAIKSNEERFIEPFRRHFA